MSDIKLLNQIAEYDKPWCYQYQKRLDTLKEDMKKYGWSEEDINNISLDDFEFISIDGDDKKGKKEATDFIKRYEAWNNWLFSNTLVYGKI